MANISALKKVTFTVTTAQESGNYVVVPIRWPSAMCDTNYVVGVDVEQGDPTGFYQPFIVNLTPAGFDAVLTNNDGANAGDRVTVHAMASHK